MGRLSPLGDAREAIAAIISRSVDCKPALKVYGYVPDGGAATPFGLVSIEATRPILTGSDQTEVDFSVIVMAGAQISKNAQEILDQILVGPGSLRRALEADPTLDGTVLSSTVARESRSLDRDSLGGIDGWAHEWAVTAVMAT